LMAFHRREQMARLRRMFKSAGRKAAAEDLYADRQRG